MLRFRTLCGPAYDIYPPAVRHGCCAAFSVDTDGEERLVVVAELDHRIRREEGGAADLEVVFAAIRRAIAKQHGLALFAVQMLGPGAIPKASSGKLQRHASRNASLSGELEAVAEYRSGTDTIRKRRSGETGPHALRNRARRPKY